MPGTLTTPLKEIFAKDVPKEVLGALLHAVLQNYADSSDYCYSNFRPTRAKVMSGHHRWAKTEDEWVGVAERHKDIVSAKETPYKHHTGSYVELTCGSVRMTQSSVTHTGQFPRDADFRDALSKSSHQYGLFLEKGEDSSDPAEGKYLYAIVIHGVHPRAKKREVCSFAWVRFPRRDCRRYYSERIDLFEMFPDIVKEYYGATEEQVAEPKLRPRKSRKAAAGE
jgi:hypothetical protein